MEKHIVLLIGDFQFLFIIFLLEGHQWMEKFKEKSNIKLYEGNIHVRNSITFSMWVRVCSFATIGNLKRHIGDIQRKKSLYFFIY